MKKLIASFILLSVMFLLSACNGGTEIETSIEKQAEKKSEKKVDEPGNTGVIPEALSASLVEVDEGTEGKDFIYEVKNNTDKEIEIPFDENGGHVYVLRDQSGKEVNRNDGLGTIQSNQIVSAGEAITIKIGMGGLKKGTYELEVWMESELDNTYNQTITFTIE
ncbi:hypothetical protein [Mesobacillus subterraneus]|uniref:Intracellular proteinase inhibitor BsuPI domain-containing protein n=1 Tax=Mesobacillus subterraneus TaxID=285983 RepID=A0A427TX47_9BACI|nr:hypothetical protein [Mesobacillus subterraneus]RSD29049.1 hypothetical protein EJA10_02770 [Mesobacillus subterraneus]